MGAANWFAPSESSPPQSPAPVRTVSQPAAAPERVVAPSQLQARAEPAPAIEAPARRSARLEAETKTAPSTEPAPAPAPVDPSAARAAFPEPVQAVAPPPTPAPASARDRARLESQRVAEARALLHAGDPRGALALLHSVASEFPNGVLVQEREALTVDALLASGDRDGARQRASDFVQRYPDSPHAPAVQRALH
jgi:TolA-binding protein